MVSSDLGWGHSPNVKRWTAKVRAERNGLETYGIVGSIVPQSDHDRNKHFLWSVSRGNVGRDCLTTNLTAEHAQHAKSAFVDG